VELEMDREIVWPGQATAYMLGGLEIVRLRDGARQALGPRFDIGAFHDRVLDDGALTMPRARADRWTAREHARR
jgi:uncharacterized protein (DUF885 family)